MQELNKLWKKVMPEKDKTATSAVMNESPVEDLVLVGH